jgi:hypothetical protein
LRQWDYFGLLAHPQERASVALGQLPLLDEVLHFIREFQKPQPVGYRRPVPSYKTGDLGLGKVELRTQSLISGGFIDGRELVALKILNQCQREQRRIIDVFHYRRNFGPVEPLNRSPAALPGDELVLAIARANHHRLKQTRCIYRSRKLG